MGWASQLRGGARPKSGAARRIAVGIVTHESRSGALHETVEHLRQLGIPNVEISETTGPPAPIKVRRGFARLIELLAGPGIDGLLLLEDDVRLRRDWRELLAVVTAADYITVLCNLSRRTIPAPFSAWIAARLDGQLSDAPTVTPRVAPLVNPIDWYGTQAMYVPAWLAPHLLLMHKDAGDAPCSFDGLLKLRMLEAPVSFGMMTAIPDVAMHLSPPSVLNPARRPRREHMSDWVARHEIEITLEGSEL